MKLPYLIPLGMIPFFFYGCRKAPKYTISDPRPDVLTIPEAREWFAGAQQQAPAPDDTALGQSAALYRDKFTPEWKNVKQRVLPDKNHILEIPILTQHRFSVMIKTNDTADTRVFPSGSAFRPTRNFARLLMAKDSSGNIQAMMMEIIGLDTYLRVRNYNLVQNNFLKTDSSFTGVVLFRSFPGGKFMRGYHYIDGIRRGEVMEKPRNKANSNTYAKYKYLCVLPLVWEYTVCSREGTTVTCDTYAGGIDDVSYECGGGSGGSSGSGSGMPSGPLHSSGNPGGGIPTGYPAGGNDKPALEPLGKVLLKQALDENSFALFGPCPVLEEWKSLATYKVPQSVRNRIETLRQNESKFAKLFPYNTWAIQDIEDAKGPVVNLDYYPIIVKKLPNQFRTPDAFLNYIRLHMSAFVGTTFEPYDAEEAGIFNSSNPLGAVLHIDFKSDAEINVEDGSIIVSGYNPSKWMVTTVQSPWDFQHPVSGNREWGYKRNVDGSYTFYTRGADRITGTLDNWYNFMADHSFNAFTDQLTLAEEFWSSFQREISEYVNHNGGDAISGTSIVMQPDMEQVYNVLFKSQPPEQIPCAN